MKTRQFFVGLIVILLACLAAGCVSLQFDYPTTGIWYCEDLDMYLDMEASNGYSLRTGEREPVIIQITQGTYLHICFCEDEWDESYENCETLNVTFRYRENRFELTDTATNNVYLFTEVTPDP